MAIEKFGTPQKITLTKLSQDTFDSMYTNIVRENSLVYCPKCNKLISKQSTDMYKTIQHRGLKVIVDGTVLVQCPKCGEVISF